MPGDSKWHWLTGDKMISVKKVEVRHLAEALGKVWRGKGEAGSPREESDAREDDVMQNMKKKRKIAKNALIKARKDSPSFWSIDYSAFGSPFSWGKSTLLKILLIMMIQAGSLSIFFILRRIRSIQQAQLQDPTPSFDAYKGVAPKTRISSRSGQALGRRGRVGGSRLHNK